MFDFLNEFSSRYLILSPRSKIMIVLFETVLFFVLAAKTKKYGRLKNNIALYILLSYLFLIFVSTFFARIHWQILKIGTVDFARINFNPLYSYFKIKQGSTAYLQEAVMNCLMFVPIGFLMPCIYDKLTTFRCAVICFCISVLIEFLQFIYSCGNCALSDVMHNVLGALLGIGVFKAAGKIYRVAKQKARQIKEE